MQSKTSKKNPAAALPGGGPWPGHSLLCLPNRNPPGDLHTQCHREHQDTRAFPE